MVLQGLRVLDYACEEASEHLQDSLDLWSLLQHEIKVASLRKMPRISPNLSWSFCFSCLLE